jgi:uncharacterized protein
MFDNPILRRIRAALHALRGDRIERIVLFGSQARHVDSDYDINVFLEGLTDRWGEFRRLAHLRTEILAETGGSRASAGCGRRRIPLGTGVPRGKRRATASI